MAQLLIHIGYPKAGSKYLQQWFKEHPALFFNERSVAGFYSSHDLSSYAEKIADPHECFVLSCEELSSWKGDVDVVGMKSTRMYDVRSYQNNLAITLKRLYPQATILIVTRGYAGFFSSINHEIIAKGGILRYSELHDIYGDFFSLTYDYSYVVGLYRRIFGNGNVLVLPYELLENDPGKFTESIEKKIGVSRHFTFTREKINASFDNKTLAAYRVFSNFLYNLIKPLPYSWKKSIYTNYIMQLNKRKPNPMLEWLGRMMNEEKETGIERTLEIMKGKADIFKEEELYQPYLKEYLIQR